MQSMFYNRILTTFGIVSRIEEKTILTSETKIADPEHPRIPPGHPRSRSRKTTIFRIQETQTPSSISSRSRRTAIFSPAMQPLFCLHLSLYSPAGPFYCPRFLRARASAAACVRRRRPGTRVRAYSKTLLGQFRGELFFSFCLSNRYREES